MEHPGWDGDCAPVTELAHHSFAGAPALVPISVEGLTEQWMPLVVHGYSVGCGGLKKMGTM
jgi:hypothetical protein